MGRGEGGGGGGAELTCSSLSLLRTAGTGV